MLKLDTALAKLEHKLETSFTTTHKLNQTFLKIKSANSEFLKLRTANSTFLKIDSTAANSGELGGLTPEAFFQGTGHVVTGSIANVGTSPSQLLALPGGIIVVDVADVAGIGPTLTITNGSGVSLSGVFDLNGRPENVTLNPGANQMTLASPDQRQLQIFPNGTAFPQVVTLIVSVENVNGPLSAVGQAFAGVPS